MTKFIYFNRGVVTRYDNISVTDSIAHWFHTYVFPLGTHLYSRTHDLETPWPLVKNLMPMPEIQTNNTRFDIAIETAAHDFCELVKSTGKTAYCSWSGGIDSTSILVSILKVADQEVLDHLVIECNEDSIAENPYFYYRFIDGKLPTQKSGEIQITKDNFDKILLVDGDCAEMILGSTYANKLAYLGKFDELDSPWRKIYDEDFQDRALISKHTNLRPYPALIYFTLDLIAESIRYSPLPINTYYDFLCWQYFNFKIVDSMMRDLSTHTKNLNPEQSSYFSQNSLHRFYLHPAVQSWHMATQSQRRDKLEIDGKFFAKKYIYDFDGNDIYFYNKMKSVSIKSNWPENGGNLIFAIDEHWNKYSLANREHRQMLGRLLNRV